MARARLTELIKKNYEMLYICCEEEEGQVEEGDENDKAEELLILVTY